MRMMSGIILSVFAGGLLPPLATAETQRVSSLRAMAQSGDANAQFKLGAMYDQGDGVGENDTEAIKWYRLAAEQGNAKAQSNLGFMYQSGDGVPRNFVYAYKWYSLSAAQGDFTAAYNLDKITGLMTFSEIAEAHSLAAAWTPSGSGSTLKKGNPAEAAGPREGSGTGFYVTTDGLLVTNAHVVRGCERITLANGSRLSIVDVDAASDLALLRDIDAEVTTPLALRQGRGVRLAESVLVAGYPLAGLLSSGLNATTGNVSALAGLGDDRRRIQITAPLQPGNSGGPVLDQSGNVVGVVVSKLDAVAVASAIGDIPQNVNFAVSLGTLQALLDENSVEYKTRASSVPSSNVDVAELAKSATVQVLCSS